ncbi:hypothetical protein, partial [Streptomyces cacaoi]|uniref:hypothetical protein n=1 Tax=Streptomyces cacaoi TaxID=1898 RepID=UPI002633E04B
MTLAGLVGLVGLAALVVSVVPVLLLPGALAFCPSGPPAPGDLVPRLLGPSGCPAPGVPAVRCRPS